MADGATSKEIPLLVPKNLVFPITRKFLPQPLHYVENVYTKPFHATRIEFKQGFPAGISRCRARAAISASEPHGSRKSTGLGNATRETIP
jgi:hypothetical protein